MTAPRPEARERMKDTLWVTDAEMIRRLGVPEKVIRPVIKALDEKRGSGFPPKKKLFGYRRYWPAVLAYFDRVGGLTMDAPQRRERHG